MDNTRGFEQKPEWSVWVGGGEVNDYYLTLQDAQDLANHYEAQGYTDVALVMNSQNAVLRNQMNMAIHNLGKENNG